MKRRDQNIAQKEWDALKLMWAELDTVVSRVILRGTHDSGIRKSFKSVKGDREDKTPPPAYADPTGESAIRDGVADKVEHNIVEMTSLIHKALNIAKMIMSDNPVDAAERAKRSIPNCEACGDLIVGKIFYGRWDNKCRVRFKRWVQEGNQPDEKIRFERLIQSQRDNVHHVHLEDELDEWRIKSVDTLRERKELPPHKDDKI